MLPQVVQNITTSYSGREAYLGLGAIVLIVSLPIIFKLVRDDPNDMGLGPDGETLQQSTAGGPHRTLPGFTAGEAARRPAFWLMIGFFAMVGLITVAIMGCAGSFLLPIYVTSRCR